MDEKFTSVIEKLDEVTETSNNALANIKKQYEKVRKTQEETDNLLNQTKEKLSAEIDKHKDKNEKLIESLEKDFSVHKKNWEEIFQNSSGSLKELDRKYQVEVNELIATIKVKAQEILRIDELLENMRRDFSNTINESKRLVEKNDRAVKDLEKKVNQISEIEALKKINADIEVRIKKLEKDNHTHAFFGSKS